MFCSSTLSAYLFLLTYTITRGLPIHEELHDIIRIIGGNVTDIKFINYQVSIRDAYLNHFCGGMVLNDNHVLTAAHCVDKKRGNGNLYCVVGVNSIREGKLIPVINVAIHPGYERETVTNDLAVLKTKYDLGINNTTVAPVTLAKTVPLDGTSCIISGWGSLIEPPNPDLAKPTLFLRSAFVPIYNQRKCRKTYRDLYGIQIPVGTICAGYESGGTDTCQGDSGGPLVCDNFLAGIVSFGVGCGKPSSPGVYTDVATYHGWIVKSMNSSSKTFPYMAIFIFYLHCFVIVINY